MVFESLVVELMNKYLGEYIENLDASQLKLSVWSGNVVLENLHVKGDALKDLNLPVQIKFGHIGKLVLKVPWKNLYKEAVEATLDGLYLLAVPNAEMEYDAEKEAKREREAKQAQIKAIEEQQLKNKKGPTEEKKDSFVEKLATQVIKNLQIHIQNIHIRYEDKVTIKSKPFSLGVTLHNLSFETTDENWKPRLLDESVKIIYKRIDLEALSVYWNSNPTAFLTDESRPAQLQYFKDTIASPKSVTKGFEYIINPITLQVRLRINPNPKSDLTIPKIVLAITLQDLGLRLLHTQYHGVMELAESMDKMAVNAPFRKYKPKLELKGHASLWWKYAYNSLLSTGVIPRAGKWSWSSIKQHRQQIREYKKLYKEILQQKKPAQKLNNLLMEMEDKLDIFNITLARQTSEVELAKAGKKILSKESVHQPKNESNQGGWFSGWFGKKKAADKPTEKPAEGLDAVMSQQEKNDLYQAIGYSESDNIVDMSEFDKTYVGFELTAELKKLYLELSDAAVSDQDILSLKLINVCSVVRQRPSAEGLGVTADISSFSVTGLTQGDFVPCIISSDIDGTSVVDKEKKQQLFTLLFEKNPIDETCDQRVVVDSQPLKIVYDAVTVNSLIDFVKPPDDVRLQQLRAVAASAYDDIKEQTATGLQHVMETKSVIEIGVRLASSFVVIPQNGRYKEDENCLILDLGDLEFQSSNEGRTPLMKKPDESLILEDMRRKVYDNFKIDLSKIQLLYARKVQTGLGQNWMEARGLQKSPMHILEPLNISILLQKCMVLNDAALPRLKISGEIPLLSVRMSDKRVENLLRLVDSIPLPAITEEEKNTELQVIESWTEDKNRPHLKTLNKMLAVDKSASELSTTSEESESDYSDTSAAASPAVPMASAGAGEDAKETQITEMKISFAIKEMVATIVEELESGDTTDLLALRIGTLSLALSQRTWDMTIAVVLQSISVELPQFASPDGKSLFLVDSVGSAGGKDLLRVELIQVKKESPEFESVYNKTEQQIIIRFGTLKLALHAQALVHLAKFGQKLADIQSSKPEPATPVKPTLAIDTDLQRSRSTSAMVKKAPIQDKPVVNLLVDAQLDLIEIAVLDGKKYISDLQIRKVNASVTITAQYMKVNARLNKLLVVDASSDSLYREIVSSVGSTDVLVLELTNYNGATVGKDAFEDIKNVDTSVLVNFGSTRVVFLNKFIQELVNYGGHFSDFQDVAASAGSAAQEKAAAKAQELAESLQSSNPRIKLDVSVTAPTVIVPTNSMSHDAIVADLGIITVNNRFSGSSLQQGFAVSDQMVVSLRNMKISKCSLAEDMTIKDETRILQEVSLSIQVVRNLSTSWYHDIPDVTVHGRLPPISVKLSQPDLEAVFQLLDGNIKEGLGSSEKNASLKDSKKPAVDSVTPSRSRETTRVEVAAPKKIWETLQVDFQLDVVTIELFSDSSRLLPLSKLELLRLKTNLTMRNDESMNANFAFGELALDDARKSSAGGITKLIRNKVQEAGGNLVTATVVQAPDGSLRIDSLVSSISVIISVEFLLKLATFFTDAIASTSDEAARAVLAAEEGLSKTEHALKPAETAPTSKSKQIKLKFNLQKPDIVLVTDVKSKDAEAIVLGMMLDLDYEMTPNGDQQKILANINDLHINACPFKAVMKKKLQSPLACMKVLAPCNINLDGEIDKTKQDFNVSISDIRLKASPVLIHTISDIAAQLTPAEQEKDEKEEGTKGVHEPLTVWAAKKIKDMNLWFMKDSVVESMVDKLDEVDGPAANALKETAKVNIPVIQVILEGGIGHHTVPLFIAELTVQGKIADWSSGEMNGEVEVTLGMAYFNDLHSVWEPLIEPNEVDSTAVEPKYEPWKVVTRLQQRKKTAQDDDSADLPPLMSITLESKHILQTTISNAAIKVLKELGIAFKDAALSKELGDKHKLRKRIKTATDDSGAALVVKNYLGRDLFVELGESLCFVMDQKKTENGVLFEKNSRLLLDYKATGDSDLLSILSSQVKKVSTDTAVLYLRVEGGKNCIVNLSKAGSVLHSLSGKKEEISFVAEVTSVAGIRKIVLRSQIVLYNELSLDVDVLNAGGGGDDSELGVLHSKNRFFIPPQLVARSLVKLKLAANNELEGCILSWKEAAETIRNNYHSENYLQFAPASDSGKPVHFCVEFMEEKLVRGSETKGDRPGLKIYLRPTVIFSNFLPFSVQLGTVTGKYDGQFNNVEPGNQIQVLDADITKSSLKVNVSYRGDSWSSSFLLTARSPELSPWEFTNSQKKTITFAKQINQKDGVLYVTLYSPYWMVNQTGFPLDYKPSDGKEVDAVQHPDKIEDILLFSYTSKSFLSKNKLQLRVCNSSFSDSFSIDTVGSSGTITCKTKSFNYMIGMQIALTSFTLTKMITFTSYYSFYNKSDFDIEISECNDRWLPVNAGKKIDLWPEQKERFLVARLQGVKDATSVKFRYDQLDSGVLIRLNDYALFVEVSVTEMSVEVSVRNYFEGATALLLVNATSDLSFQFWQAKTEAKNSVSAGQACHLIWTDPTKPRVVTWLSSSKKEVTMDVFEEHSSFFTVDETGKTAPKSLVSSLRDRSAPGRKIYSVLFGDGLQRVLLFTEDRQRAKVVEAQIRLERANLEIELALHGIACSLTDSTAKREVAFVAITSSGLVWEEKPNKRWKPLAVKYSQLLEESYQKQLKGAEPQDHISLDKYAFNLKTMKVTMPQVHPLQRSFTPGLWVQFTTTANQMTVHAKINRLQVDNQLQGAVFPVVLHPVPLPKSIAVDSSPKPFLEVSLMQRNNEQQSFLLIKYFKVLVQEFSIKLDMGFITALLPVFGAEELKTTPEQELKYFKKDVLYAETKRDDDDTSGATVNFFDILHLSPIKVHISFSMQNSISGRETGGSGASDVVKLPFDALSVLLKSVGVTLSDIDDVVFKLAYFERKYQFFSSSQFAHAVGVHYAGQAVKQLYVLVFGLDVIGNPYGLVMGIAEGVTDLFYEPYQGIIQGPGEFFEGLGLGALSLLGHTFGGAAGAVSKVTGALGKGIASITMDDEFKRKRLEDKNKQPADLKEGLARGGKGLVMGVVSGITGVVTKPIEGAKKEGAAGFFKGVGKGLIGVVARPVSGVIDLASNTFEGIQKVADMSEEVRKIRPARWIDQRSGIIQPYSLKRAQGAAILEELEEGRFFSTNTYVDHAPLKPDRKSIIMLTQKMILTAHTGDILGQWKCDWKCPYLELIGEPELIGNQVKFDFKLPNETQNVTGLNIFGGQSPSSVGNPAPAAEKVFRPFARAFSLGVSAIIKRPPLVRSETEREPAVAFSTSRNKLRMQGSVRDAEEQNKTRSFFGMKHSHETVVFHNPAFAKFILLELKDLRGRAIRGSSSSDSTSASSFGTA